MKGNHKHGHDRQGMRSPELRAYHKIRERCYNPNCKDYVNYGGRGIVVCDAWLADFKVFLADMGLRPSSQHSIDRIDVNGPYSPQNCRWATRQTQNSNTRRNRYITINGETHHISEWLRRLKVSKTVFYRRIKKGQTEHEALGVAS